MSFSSIDDNVLIQLYCTNGDKKAFGELYRRYIAMVYSVCIKYLKNETLAEDLSQQVFEKLLRIVCQHEIKYFKSWLYQTSKNHCLMYLRKKRHVEFDSEKVEYAQGDVSTQGIEEKQQKERNFIQLEQAIENLNNEQKRCLKLFYLDKRSYAEIQEITGWSYGEVKSHIQNAKRNLKNALNI